MSVSNIREKAVTIHSTNTFIKEFETFIKEFEVSLTETVKYKYKYISQCHVDLFVG